jgi:hypothetical protein
MIIYAQLEHIIEGIFDVAPMEVVAICNQGEQRLKGTQN